MFRALQCPSSGARQTAVAVSGFHMNVEVEVFSTVVGLLANRPRLRTLPHFPSSRARPTVVAASGFRMNVEVEVFRGRPRLRTLPPPHSYGNQRLQRQFEGLLMMGIVMPETC